MPRDGVSKVLDLEGALDSRRKEASEGRDQRGEAGNHERVELDGRQEDLRVPHERHRQVVVPLHEDWGGSALQLLKEGEGESLLRADEEGLAREEVGHDEDEEEGAEHAPDEAFPGLLGGELDERSPPEEVAEEIGGAVVGDHGEGWQGEPEEPLVHVVGDEGGRHENQDQGQDRPGKPRKLVPIGTLVQ
eukprot:CAMPEP_0170543810 /NCGR_PEP_ID=MMETSP0211-20121228/2797_1 /TAXON_ID=311385 /ORGANISM="Pseudokeronopsis sp., Strain OXSARD2" /LENGTH=189 /DNA_ID=CAMNT_0010847281 /DNA_START=221 /DNA_END=790 /DNA_ORIENTATION=-